jgi:hypothetical protein
MSTPADNLRAAADAVLAQNAALAARVAQVEEERDGLRSRLTVAERVIDSRNVRCRGPPPPTRRGPQAQAVAVGTVLELVPRGGYRRLRLSREQGEPWSKPSSTSRSPWSSWRSCSASWSGSPGTWAPPEILVKGLIAIGVLFALILFVRAFLYHDGPAFHVFLGNGTPALRS